jgi:hypothetical protein
VAHRQIREVNEKRSGIRLYFYVMFAEFRSFVGQFREEFSCSLDVLVNNAAIGSGILR